MATEFGIRLERIRKEQGLTRAQLARRINRSATLIGRLETSDTINPREETVKVICSGLGINDAWLLNGTGEIYANGEPEKSDVRTRLRSVRKQAGLTQKEFADRIGYSLDHIKSVESGRANASDELLRDVSLEFSVSSDWLRSGIKVEDNLGSIISYLSKNQSAQEVIIQLISRGDAIWDEIKTKVLQI